MKRREGFVLGITLIVFLTITLLGTTLSTLAIDKARRTNELEQRTQAYYLARSGVVIAKEFIEVSDIANKKLVLSGNLKSISNGVASFSFQDKSSAWSGLSDNDIRASIENFNAQARATNEVVIGIWSDGDTSCILSFGNIGDFSRTVAVAFETIGASGTPIFDLAVYSKYSFEFQNGTINGNVGTESIVPGTFTIDNTGINGNISIGPGGVTTVGYKKGKNYINSDSIIQTKEWIWNNWLKDVTIAPLPEPRDYPMPDFPDFPDSPTFPAFPEYPTLSNRGNYTAGWWPNPSYENTSGHYQTLSVQGELIIELNSSNLKIRADTLTMGGSGIITVVGPGTLSLYVDNFNMGSGSFRLQNGARCNMYVSGSFDTGNSQVTLNNLYIKGDGDVDFSGALHVTNMYIDIDGGVSLSGSGAPTVNDVAIIKANTFSANGGGGFDITGGELTMFITDTLSINSNITIADVHNGSIYAANLNLSQGHITLSGEEDDNLEIYVDTSFNMGGSASVNGSGSIDNTKIYYSGSANIDVSGAQTFAGTFFSSSPEADLNLKGGGNIDGMIITASETVNMTGGSSANVIALYAPDADVTMQGGGNMNGAIISKNFHIQGGASVTYVTEVADYFPPGLELGTGEATFEVWSE